MDIGIQQRIEEGNSDRCGGETTLYDLKQTRRYLYSLAGDTSVSFELAAIHQKPNATNQGKTENK